MENLLIKHVMTAVPIQLSVRETVQTALGVMQMHEVRHLPIVDGQEVIGVVSERDLLAAQSTHEHVDEENDSPLITKVCSIDKYQVGPDTPLADVLETMAKKHIGSALITQGGVLLGIFTATDACRFWAKQLRGEAVNQL